jgi:peptide/nickel transport system substrate-binding protein
MKRTLCLGVFAVWLAMAGCAKNISSEILIYARGSDAKKLDPADIQDGESVKVCTNLFETLVTFAPTSADVVPCLALSWTPADKGRTWHFKLREGVRFHDGTTFDAEAVVFAFQRLLDPGNPYRFHGKFPYAENFQNIAKVEATGPLEVVFRLREPSVVFLANLAMFPAAIPSPAGVKKHDADTFKNPVGTGPFRFVSWLPDEKIVIEAFEGYWGTPAKVKRIIFKPVPENAARRAQLEKGEVHMIDGVSLSDIEALRKVPGLVVDVRPAMNFGYLAMNTLRPPFDKREIRQAVALAIDKEKIRTLAFHGVGELGPNPIPPNVFGYNSGIRDRDHDPAAARKLLRLAGVGGTLSVKLFAMPNPRPYMPNPRKVAQVIKESLSEVGIDAEIVSPEWQIYLEQVMNGKHDMCLLGWTTDNGDPDNFLWQLLDSSNARIGTAMNVSFYRNPDCDSLFATAKRTVDRAERKALYEKAQEIIFSDVPLVTLGYLPQVVAYRKEVSGYTLHPLGLVRLWNLSLKKP